MNKIRSEININVFFPPEDVQKGNDIQISRQFKESVIRPILKVTHVICLAVHWSAWVAPAPVAGVNLLVPA